MGWNTQFVDQEFGPLLVADGTGRAYVDPANADVVLTSGDEWTVEGGEEPPLFISDFLRRETDLDPVHRRDRRYQEFRLDLGEQVRVAGEADPDSAVDDAGPVTTAILDDGDAPKFFVTDDPDLDLGSRMRQEALIYFLIGGILLALSAMSFFM